MTTLSIGAVARRTGISVEAIRFYERQGLIREPRRRPSGYRQYGQDDITRLSFIQQAKALGFSLQEIGELLSLSLNPAATCGDVRARASAKLADVEERIRKLKRMQRALRKLVADCPGTGSVVDCPILEALDTDGVRDAR